MINRVSSRDSQRNPVSKKKKKKDQHRGLWLVKQEGNKG
jgi:hypothetical protein